jgi:hypothetical protein
MSVLDRLPKGYFAPKTIDNPVGMPEHVHAASGRYDQVNPALNYDAYTPAPGVSSPIVQPAPSIQIFPAWERPPKGSQLFSAPNRSLGAMTGTLAAGAGSQLALASLVYGSPSNYITVIRTVSAFINAPDGANDISWILEVNGQAQQNGAFTIFPFIAGAVIRSFSVVFRDIEPNSTISLLIVNNAASGPYTVGGGFSGWSYAIQAEQLLTGGLPT